jgi:hypothetical protein
MCTVGKVRCLSGFGNFTTNSEYVILSVTGDAGSAPSVTTLDDLDNPRTVSVDNSSFEFAELYATTKVV